MGDALALMENIEQTAKYSFTEADEPGRRPEFTEGVTRRAGQSAKWVQSEQQTDR